MSRRRSLIGFRYPAGGMFLSLWEIFITNENAAISGWTEKSFTDISIGAEYIAIVILKG